MASKKEDAEKASARHLPFQSVAEFEEHAKVVLPKQAYDYYSSGATNEVSLRENCQAFSRLLLRWRCLRGITNADLRTTVQGDAISSPICVAPTAMQRMACPDGEVAMARACARSKTVMTLSTWATSSIEQVAAASAGDPASLRWFQLYIYSDREITRRLAERAERCGYKAIAVTVDTPRLGIRYADMENKFTLPRHLTLANFDTSGAHASGVKGSSQSGLAEYVASLIDRSLCWDDIDWLKSITKLPIIVKGVMNAEDATEALRRGVSGIWVSNHGARQLDSTAATIEVLPEVVHAVNGRVEVYVDGGVRNGGDVLKALALGARAVFVGRPALWGLACNGEAGVCQVLELLNKELELSMALCGCPSVLDVPESIVVPAARYRSAL
eukprot:scpid76147/ scgid34442/ Hydroxyacid oxidase 1; Glycolate oxidase